MTTLLIEPFGGMAGDMFLAALLDLGGAFAESDLRGLAASLVPGEFELEVGVTKRASIRATCLNIRTPESVDPPHRHLSDLLALLASSGLSASVEARAGRTLRRIAEAEAKVHGIDVDHVHFHEVGAVDTLIDVAGAMIALERLGVVRVVATTPYVGGGTVHCAHGEMPVPAPGTAALLAGVETCIGPGGERLTPTAAAILVEITDEFVGVGTLTLRPGAIGYGAGSRTPKSGPPNLMRVALCTESVRTDTLGADRAALHVKRAEAWLLECNLDDTTGEEMGFLLGELRRAGALEAWSAPVQMKKDRPAAVVSALARAEQRDALEAACFAHSPTLGVRWTRTERSECERSERTLELHGHPVRIKIRMRGDGLSELDVSPEFDDLVKLASETGLSLRALEHEAIRLALGSI